MGSWMDGQMDGWIDRDRYKDIQMSVGHILYIKPKRTNGISSVRI